MKRFSTCFAVIFLLLQLLCSFTVHAENHVTKFAEVPREERLVFLDAIELEPTSVASSGNSISNYDVRDDGMLVLTFDGGQYSYVDVFDSEGTFAYGYRFNHVSSAYSAFWNDGYVGIFFYKSDYILNLDSNGKCISFYEMTSYSPKVDEALNRTTSGIPMENNNRKYYPERDFAVHQELYSRFIIEDADGNTHIIYDASSEHNLREGIMMVFLGTLGIGIIVIASRHLYMAYRKMMDER